MTIPALIPPGGEDDPACDRCGTARLDIIWCVAFGEWLCGACRDVASDTALRMTLAEKRALDARAREAS